MELVDWLVLRGASKVVINSRRGITNGYQSFRLKWLRELYGADVRISTADITQPEGAKELVSEAVSMGPVAGIFNLAVVRMLVIDFHQVVCIKDSCKFIVDCIKFYVIFFFRF